MINLKEVSEYSAEELNFIANKSPSFNDYYQRTQKNKFSIIIQHRHKAWMMATAATLLKNSSTEDICKFWSNCADEIVQHICNDLAKEKKEMKNIALFALGKWGAQELNLSSDIDLLIVCENLEEEMLSICQVLQKNLHPPTSDYCFRLDFDLRPGGRFGPLVSTFSQLEDYYGNYGEAWERLAFVRLRPIWGKESLINNIMEFAEKFSFRKHLDFSLLSDLRILRQRIHTEYWHRSTNNQIDLKLGLGGIRDVELFVHTLQVVHGGKNPALRTRSTSQALDFLNLKKLLPSTDALFLKSHYWKLRYWENLVQCLNDQQTHILPISLPLISSQDLNELTNDMIRCDQIVSELLGKFDPNLNILPENKEQQFHWLQEKGFSNQAIEIFLNDILEIQILSRQKEKDEALKKRFLYLFINKLSSQTSIPDQSLFLLKDFLQATRAKSSFFSLLINQENLTDQLAKTFATSPFLSRILIHRPELLDSIIYRSNFIDPSADLDTFLDNLSEHRMLSHFIFGTEFLSDLDVKILTNRCSLLADTIALDVLKKVAQEFNASPPHILALGKWGSQELGLRSDLDLIFVTDEFPSEVDIKIARRWVNRMTEPRKGGPLYDIDFRLRPAESGGIIVTRYLDLKEYLSNKAEAWVCQAYLRARWISKKLSWEDVKNFFLSRGLSKADLWELNKIRKALLELKKNEMDLKYSEGGLVDVELALQTKILIGRFKKNAEKKTLNVLEEIEKNYLFLRQIEQLHQLLSFHSTAVLDEKNEDFKAIAKRFQMSAEKLEIGISRALHDNLSHLKIVDPRRSSDYEEV